MFRYSKDTTTEHLGFLPTRVLLLSIAPLTATDIFQSQIPSYHRDLDFFVELQFHASVETNARQ